MVTLPLDLEIVLTRIFRSGGTWLHVMSGPDGRDYRFKGVYHEIVPPERIVATECFDEQSLGSPEWRATIILQEQCAGPG